MTKPTRRHAIKTMLGTTLALSGLNTMAKMNEDVNKHKLKGNINHAVCRWTYGFLSLEQLCIEAKKIGIKAIDLIGPADWHILKQYDLDSSMCNGAEISLAKGWNDKNNHDELISRYNKHIDLVADAGYKNLILFSGNRNGMDDVTGLKNAVEGLKKILPKAEKRNVVLQIEIFNSKVDHKDYMADNTKWAVDLCKQLGTPNFKILYDIYHMQVNEGNIIATIKANHEYLGHYHTAGVPGRHEIIATQELNYPAIMKAIVDTGYNGYVAQEFIPTGATPKDKLAALKEAVKICDV